MKQEENREYETLQNKIPSTSQSTNREQPTRIELSLFVRDPNTRTESKTPENCQPLKQVSLENNVRLKFHFFSFDLLFIFQKKVLKRKRRKVGKEYEEFCDFLGEFTEHVRIEEKIKARVSQTFLSLLG